jgi:hypothetical protein
VYGRPTISLEVSFGEPITDLKVHREARLDFGLAINLVPADP